MCVGEKKRDRERETERENYFKELASVTVGPVKSGIFRAGRGLELQGRADAAVLSLNTVGGHICFFFRETSVFEGLELVG